MNINVETNDPNRYKNYLVAVDTFFEKVKGKRVYEEIHQYKEALRQPPYKWGVIVSSAARITQSAVRFRRGDLVKAP